MVFVIRNTNNKIHDFVLTLAAAMINIESGRYIFDIAADGSIKLMNKPKYIAYIHDDYIDTYNTLQSTIIIVGKDINFDLLKGELYDKINYLLEKYKPATISLCNDLSMYSHMLSYTTNKPERYITTSHHNYNNIHQEGPYHVWRMISSELHNDNTNHIYNCIKPNVQAMGDSQLGVYSTIIADWSNLAKSKDICTKYNFYPSCLEFLPRDKPCYEYDILCDEVGTIIPELKKRYRGNIEIIAEIDSYQENFLAHLPRIGKIIDQIPKGGGLIKNPDIYVDALHALAEVSYKISNIMILDNVLYVDPRRFYTFDKAKIDNIKYIVTYNIDYKQNE